MKLGDKPFTGYIGFDPDASSYYVESLIPIIVLAHIQRYKHRPKTPICIATGLIGDSNGKTKMRKLLTLELEKGNALGINR